ncbi:MAG: 4-hydroxythreonine-4-phosphate dehydrogenase PdxA [Pseudomonadales bacterium]|jgi:4-hydroxythreonine-4-phosphate dehydrogenase|nr:4-hydroxythreonine-4-phosphate dehydrogenase PdxA [Pseudomonadales bacterium]
MNARLAITPGEPAGIGPELVVQLAQRPRSAHWVVVADPELLRSRAEQLGLPLELMSDDPAAGRPDAPGTLRVRPVPLPVPSAAGRLDPANAPYVLATLDAAIDGCLAGDYDGLVTAPVHKAMIAGSGVPFTGHTEYLAERTGAEAVLMVLVADALRVALVTTHVPLAGVPALITRERVDAMLRLFVTGLRERYGLEAPRVLVAGLNPHAGEDGLLGREEIEVIAPVCEAARAEGLDVVGPLPADTLFTPDRLAAADGVLAMYHDQGLPVLKHAGFGRAVNVTFGLPIVRTSVDHGTALDIAGTGRADAGSLAAAIAAAEAMAARRRERCR